MNLLFKKASAASFFLILNKILKYLVLILAAKKAGISAWGEISYTLILVTYVLFITDCGSATWASFKYLKSKIAISKSLQWILYNRLILHIFFLIPTIAFSLYSQNSIAIVGWLTLTVKGLNLEWLFNRLASQLYFHKYLCIRNGAQIILLVLIPKVGFIEYLLTEIFCDLLFFFLQRKFIPMDNFAGLKQKFDLFIPKRSWPYFLSGVFLLLHSNADIVMLKWITQRLDWVGTYDLAYKTINFAFLILALLPQLARPTLAQADLKNQTQTIQKIQWALITLSTLIIIIGNWILEPLFTFFFTINGSAIFSVYQILSVYLMLSAFAMPLNESLILNHPKRKYFLMAASTAILNIALNAMLIPLYGLKGSAYATLIAELWICFYQLFHLLKLNQPIGKFVIALLYVIAFNSVFLILIN